MIPEPEAGQIWLYGNPPTDGGDWEASIGSPLLVISKGAGNVKCKFVKLDDYPKCHPALAVGEFSFTVGRFKEDFNYVGLWEEGTPVPVEKRAKTYSDWTLAEKVIPESRLVLLYGPPGTGKTTAGNRVGLRGGTVVEETTDSNGLLVTGRLDPVFSIFNITLTEETPAAELRGHYIMKGGEFIWQDGTGVRPYRDGGRLVLNEIDKASGDCLQFCQNLLDDPGISAITLPTGETVTPHNDFTVVATMNGIPEDLPPALQDRFTVAIHIKMPHPMAIKSLPDDLRKPAKNGFNATSSRAKDRTVSFRAWKAFGELRETLGEQMAAQAVFGARAGTILNTLKIERDLPADSKSVKTTYVTAEEELSHLYEEAIPEEEDEEYHPDDDPRY